MRHNNLTGMLPPVVATATSLTSLCVYLRACAAGLRTRRALTPLNDVAAASHPFRRRLDSNKIAGTIPDGLGNSTALTYMCVAFSMPYSAHLVHSPVLQLPSDTRARSRMRAQQFCLQSADRNDTIVTRLVVAVDHLAA
jgi:hypothetical protein